MAGINSKNKKNTNLMLSRAVASLEQRFEIQT